MSSGSQHAGTDLELFSNDPKTYTTHKTVKKYLHCKAFLQPENAPFLMGFLQTSQKEVPPPALFVYMIWDPVTIETPGSGYRAFGSIKLLSLPILYKTSMLWKGKLWLSVAN